MADTTLSKYIQQKRDRDVFTDPAFDRLTESSGEPSTPTKGFDMLEVPKYTPPAGVIGGSQVKPKIGSVQKAILAQKMRNSGITGKEADAAMSIAETQDGGARFIDVNAPAGPSTVYADNMPAADVWSSIASGFHNTFVSFGAGVKQITLGFDGSKEEVEKIRQWQNENEVQVAKSTKRMLAEDDMNWTKFGFGVGNAVGSVAVSIAPAVALAPFGVGVLAGAAIGTAASYPMVFNSTFNSAIGAGYSPEEAATYAHMISIPITAVEFFPVLKLGRTLTSKTVGGVIEGAMSKYLPKVLRSAGAPSAIASKIAKSGISDDVLVNVYRAVNNGIKDRLLVNGGIAVGNAAAEGFTEAIQNYMERVGEVGYDNFKNKKNGEGFGTTMEDVTSMKQFWAASVDGMYGAIAGGGASIMSIGKPLYEQGVYNTLAKYDSKGRLDEGIQALTSALQAKVDAGNLDATVAKQAITSISQVASAYKKLGSGIADPRIKAAMYYGVRKKDMLTEEISMLEKKKQEIEQKIGTGEIDPDIAKFDDDQINGLIALKNKQFAFTSEWLKETASQIYANKLNSVKGEMANTEVDMDNLVADSDKVKENQSTWRKAMGFTPQFASVRVGELAKSLEGIRKEYEASSRIYGDESLKDKNLVTEFDEFESATKIIVDQGDNRIPTTSKGKFVSDGDGNYAVTLEQTDADGKTTKAYRPIPNTEYYNKRLSQIFSANKQFAPIAEKMLKGQKLTDEEAQIADDFDVDVQEIFQTKKRASDKKVDDLVESIVYSDDPLSQGTVDESNMEDFEKQGVMDKMSLLKILAPSIKKFVTKGKPAPIKSIISKNPRVGNILQKLSEDEVALDRFLKNNPMEKKGGKKAEKKAAAQPAAQDNTATQSSEQSQEDDYHNPEMEAYAEAMSETDNRASQEAETKKQIEDSDRALSESYEELGDDTGSSSEVEKEDTVTTYEDPKNPLPIEIHIPQWVDDAISKAEKNGDVSTSDAKDALDYVSRLYLIWSKAKDVTNRIYAEADIDEVVAQIKKDAATLAKYLYNKQIADEKKELKANKKRRGKNKKTLTAEEIRRASLYKADLKRQIEEYTKGTDITQEPSTKQQIKDFGVAPEMIDSVHGLISQVFSGLKKAGLTAAKTVGEWVGIGKGGVEKAYTLKINGQDVQVKNTQPEVVDGFYSPIEKSLMSFGKNSQKAKDWLNVVGKSDESVFTGVRGFIESNDPNSILSKQDILNYMKDNRIQVVEVVNDDSKMPQDRIEKLNSVLRGEADLLGFDTIQEAREAIRESKDWARRFDVEDLQELVKLGNEYRKSFFSSATKFSDYQLHGRKENYKEVLVTMPSPEKLKPSEQSELEQLELIRAMDRTPKQNRRVQELFDKVPEGKNKQFKSSHFEEPNILVHLRMNTRKDKSGNKVLFLEEIQSDWGQKGKKEGFIQDSSIIDKEISDIDKRQNELVDKMTELGLPTNPSASEFRMFSLGDTYQVRKIEEYKNTVKNNKEWDAANDRIAEIHKSIKEVLKEKDVLEKRLAELRDLRVDDEFKLPSAPFVTDTNAWTKLGLKVALKEAVEQGVDKIAWTTGEQQNERYDLRKQVDKIEIIKREKVDSYRAKVYKHGIILEDKDYIAFNQLEGMFGKEIAKKVQDGESVFEGEGLSVGGKGMKGFYGSPAEGNLGIVGNVAKSLFKQEPKIVNLGVKSEGVELARSEEDIDLYYKDGYMFMSEEKEINKQDAYKAIDKGLHVVALKLKQSNQHSVDITPELRLSVAQGQPLFKNAQAQYRVESGKNIVEAIKNFNGSPEATVALTHEIMHPTVVAIIDGVKEGNEVGAKHTQTIISEFNKANPKNQVTLEELTKGNDDFKEGKTSKKYREVQEFIAKSWEKYHKEGGKGFSAEFQKVLDQITEAFKAVYKTITGKKLTPELRQMFDEILGKDVTNNLQANDTTTTQNDSGQAETKGPQTGAQLGGANVQPALRTAIETANIAIEAVTSDRELVEQVLSEDESQDSAISELESIVEQVNRETDEVLEQQSSDQSGSASTFEKQGSSSGQQSTTQTSEVISDVTDKEFEQERIDREQEYEANDRLYSKELRDFVDTFRKVFNIEIDVVSGMIWESLGLRKSGKGVFIGSQGKVIIRSDATKAIVLQELGHVAVASIKKSAPALYKRALESVRGTIYEDKVRDEYPNLTTDEEILREALGWAIEDKGVAILNGENITPEQKSLYDRIIDYIKRIFRSIAEKIGLSVSPEFNLGDITLNQFSNEIATKILSGQKFESVFDNVINEYQPDPTDPDEYSLYGGHTQVAHQVSKMPSTANGVMVTPEVLYSLSEFIDGLQSGRIQNLTPSRIADAIKGPIDAIINSAKNQTHKWTKLASTDLSSPFANFMYAELATGGGVQSVAGKDLLNEISDLSKKYNKWVKDSHVRVIDMSSGSPVEAYSYIDHVEESKLANDKVEELKAANKGFFGKVNQFFMSDYFTDLFNIETVSEFLGGRGGVLSGIHGLIRKRNTDAAIFAKYAHRDIEAYKIKLESVFGLKTADDYFQRKVSISAFNNMDGNPTDVTMDIPLGMAADIYINYKTQSLNAPNGNDATHSSIYYDANLAGRGATDVRGKNVIYRGITQTIQDKEYNLLFDASQIAQLESMFGANSTYEFMVKDAFDFYSGMSGNKSRFDVVNGVYINVKGESLKKIPNGTYAPTRVYSEGANASHRTIGAAYDDVSFIKPRTDLPSRLQGSRDVLSAMEGYSQRAQNFIRNAEAAESLLVYEKRVKDRWNNKEMQSKLDWLKRYRKDLNSYEQDRIIKGIEESRLGIPLVSYRTIMSNFSKSVFAFNLANPPKQGAGYLGAYGLGIIDNKYLNKYKGYVTKSIINSYKGYFGADEGSFFGTNIPLSFSEENELLNEIGKYDEMSDIWLRLEDITSNTQGVPIQDVYSAYNSGQKGAAMKQFLGEKWDTITKYGLSPMRHSDRAPILAFYLAAKEQVSDMAKSGQLLDTNGNPVAFSTTVNGVETLSPQAIQLVADKVTEITYRTNNMYMSNDKTGLQRSHGFFHETIGLFSSQPQKIFNLFLGNLFRAARSNFSDKDINNTALSTFGYSVMASAAMTAAITVAYGVMKNGGLDDDDDLKRDFLVETAKNVIGIAPSGGTELLMSILSMYDNRSSIDASGQNPVFEQLTRTVVGLSAFKDSFDAKTEESKSRLEKKAMSSVTSGMGSMIGVPSSFIRVLNSEMLK